MATKAHPKWSLSYDGVHEQVATSLAELGVESVELLYLHSVDPEAPLEGALRFLAQRLAVGAVAALLCVAALASLGLCLVPADAVPPGLAAARCRRAAGRGKILCQGRGASLGAAKFLCCWASSITAEGPG